MTNRTPLSRKLRKEAMTTAAPPEKMTNAELPDRDRAMKDAAAIIKQRLKGVTIDFQNLARAFFAYASYASEDKEAARRLAPRVGDDVRKKAAQIMNNGEEPTEADYWRVDAILALSAPPAASAAPSMHNRNCPEHPDNRAQYRCTCRLSALPKGQEHEG